MTVEEFLDWDDGTDTRHMLVDGAIVAMAPPAAFTAGSRATSLSRSSGT